jgi:hypothetical protein
MLLFLFYRGLSMKVIILSAIKEWIINKIKFGQQFWVEIAAENGFDPDKFKNIDHYSSPERLQKLITAVSAKLDLSMEEINHEFIQFWVTDFAPRLYQSMTKQSNNSREFLINITAVNNEICNIFPNNKHISRMDINQMDDDSLMLMYSSEKILVDIIGILRVVSNHYNENYFMKKINPHSVELRFEDKK